MSDLLSTLTQRNWGIDHVYLRNNDMANIWEDLTGKKTVSSSDIANLEKLVQLIVKSMPVSDARVFEYISSNRIIR